MMIDVMAIETGIGLNDLMTEAVIVVTEIERELKEIKTVIVNEDEAEIKEVEQEVKTGKRDQNPEVYFI